MPKKRFKNRKRIEFNKNITMFLQIVLLVITFVLIVTYFGGCDTQAPKVSSNGPGVQKTCGGQPLGSTRDGICPAGTTGAKTEICTNNGWYTLSDTCGGAGSGGAGGGVETCDNKVSFEKNIKPLIVSKCLNCHTSPDPYDKYATAKSLGSEMAARINLSFADARRMPKQPLPELSADEKGLFEEWANTGFPENTECAKTSGTITLDTVETFVLNDLSKLDDVGRVNARYLISANKLNAGASEDSNLQYTAGIQKSLNTISRSRDLITVGSIDSSKSIYRVDLKSFGLNANDWNLVITADQIKFESFTTKGLLIKQLTGSARPWMHSDNFTFTSQQPAIFNQLAQVPATRVGLFQKVGLDFQGNFDTFEALLAGFNGSPISLNKNRLLSRHETRDGYMWVTYDSVDIGGVAQRNLFEFPFLAETGGSKIFNFAASEIIYSLPNGLQGYALYNAADQRQDAAPLNVVNDTETPFDPEIKNGISCHRCHSKGVIPAKDQIRNHVTQNASEFNANDVEIARAFFRDAAAVSASFTVDNKRFAKALSELGIDVNKTDPVNLLTDTFRADKTLKEVAGFLFLSEDEFKRLLNGSAAAKAQIGQLLTGGTISLNQLIQTFPILVQDFRLGQESLGS